MRFRLAPMDRLIWTITVLLAPLPLVLLALAPRALFPAAAFVALVYAIVLLWFRPIRFEIHPNEIVVVWPVRTARIPRVGIREVRLIRDNRELKTHLGRAYRIGAGGPWGGFGLLKTQHRGMMRFYVSRISDYVLITPATGKPWLITPANPERFARTLTRAGTPTGRDDTPKDLGDPRNRTIA